VSEFTPARLRFEGRSYVLDPDTPPTHGVLAARADQLVEAVKEVERLQRLIGEAYAARGPRSTQALRSLYGQATREGVGRD
jgi:hypothetical protein